jgi:hypothetical protein
MRISNLSHSVLLAFALQISGYAQQVEILQQAADKDQYVSKSYFVRSSLSLKPGFSVEASSNGSWFARTGNIPLAPSTDKNFVRSEVILKAGVTSETQVRSLTSIDKHTSFNYADGLGRGVLSIVAGKSPQLDDMVSVGYYDALGRPSRNYLPFTKVNLLPGSYISQPLSSQSTFFNNVQDKVVDDSKPFDEATYDNSPLNEVTQSFAVGSAWTAKPSNYAININDANIRMWTVVNGLPVSTSNYPAGALVINQIVDEDQIIAKTYKDFTGRLVLKQVQRIDNNGNVIFANTYYVYDYYGKPLFIIPPAATNFSPDQAYADRWYFQYEYDSYQRQTGSKAPGAGWVYTIYDQWDRPVLSQDANQRAKATPEWTFMKYDDMNRPIAKGTYASNLSRTELTNLVAASANRYETRNSTAVGHSLNQTFPTTAVENDLLSIVHYDDYTFINNAGWDVEANSYAFVSELGYTGTVFNSVKGLTTGGGDSA